MTGLTTTAPPSSELGPSWVTLDRRDFREMRPLTTHKWFRLRPTIYSWCCQ